MKPSLLLLLAASFATAVASRASESAPPPPRPNVLFLLVDDLGSYDVGWRGSEIKTPHLDALARSGAQLDQFYVQPVCSPTRAALLSGRYPFRLGLQTGVVRPWAQYGLPLEERTLAQALQAAGYETAITGKWHLGHFQPEYLPTRRGFDHQYGHYNGALDYYTHERDGGFDWHRDDKESRDEGYSTELIAREAVRVVKDRSGNRPLFLYVPFNGVHAPHQVPERYEAMYPQFKGARKTYAGMVTAVDDAVGQIVQALREEGLLENTLIIFSSDNGGPNPGKVTDNGALRAGKATVYEGGVRVAAFATWPGKIKPGAVVQEPIHIVDWFPTLVKLAGASLESALPLDGVDIWPTLTEGAPSPRKEVLINTSPSGGAIRVGHWKLVINGGARDLDGEAPRSPAKSGKTGEKVELFDLAADASESKDLAAGQPAKVAELRARYDELAGQAVPPKLAPKAAGFKTPRVWGEQDPG